MKKLALALILALLTLASCEGEPSEPIDSTDAPTTTDAPETDRTDLGERKLIAAEEIDLQTVILCDDHSIVRLASLSGDAERAELPPEQTYKGELGRYKIYAGFGVTFFEYNRDATAFHGEATLFEDCALITSKGETTHIELIGSQLDVRFEYDFEPGETPEFLGLEQETNDLGVPSSFELTYRLSDGSDFLVSYDVSSQTLTAEPPIPPTPPFTDEEIAFRNDNSKYIIYERDGEYYLSDGEVDEPLKLETDGEIVYVDFDYSVSFVTDKGSVGRYNIYSGELYGCLDPVELLGEFHGGKIYTNYSRLSYIEKDGVYRILYGDTVIKGDILATYLEGEVNHSTVYFYDEKLDPIGESPYSCSAFLEDGRIVAFRYEDKAFSVISGGEITKSRDYEQLLYVDDNGILVVDGGKLQIVSLDGEVVAEFDGWYEGLRHHPALSGYYKDAGKHPDTGETLPSGYYYVFEDIEKTGGQYNDPLSVEFRYEPATGETGKVEFYSSFAYAKPVLYLYPESEREISVKFEHPERLTTVYPAYDGGWFVTAKPDGTLTDGRREYYALYWEEDGALQPSFNEGFCVSSEEAAEFLESSLDTLGFTNREANEFIMYWLPILEKSPYNLVYFELTDSREGSNSLIIEPKPDSLLRVAIHILPLSEPREISPQELPAFERNGFTAIEWGGTYYK